MGNNIEGTGEIQGNPIHLAVVLQPLGKHVDYLNEFSLGGATTSVSMLEVGQDAMTVKVVHDL